MNIIILKKPLTRFILWIVCLFVICSATAFVSFKVQAQQENYDDTNSNTASSPTPTPSPTPIPTSEIILQKERTEKKLQEIEKKIAEDDSVSKSQKQLEELKEEILALEDKTNQLIGNNPSLEIFQEIENEWSKLSSQLFSLKLTLQNAATERNEQDADLKNTLKIWQESLQKIEDTNNSDDGKTTEENQEKTAASNETSKQADPTESSLPNQTPTPDETIEDDTLSQVNREVKERINSTIERINSTQKKVADSLSKILNIEETISGTQKEVSEFQTKVKNAHDEALSRIVVRDSPPIWSAESLQSSFRQTVDKSISDKVINLNNFLRNYQGRIFANFVVILFLAGVFYLIRRKTRPLSANDPELKHTLAIFESPIAIAVLLGVMFDSFVYPKMPELFDSFMNLIGLTAMFFLIKHFIKRKYYPILIAIFTLYLIDDVRSLFATIRFLSRVWFLFEMLGAIVFLVWLIRSKRILDTANSRADRVIRNISLILIPIFAFAFIAKAIGYVTLGGIVGDTLITSMLFGALYYIIVQFLESLLVLIFRTPPFSLLGMVKHHRHLIRTKIEKFLKWTAIFLWGNLTLSLVYLATPVWEFIIKILSAGVDLGSIYVSVGGILGFIFVIWLSFFISRVIRFALEEDVYTRVELADGLPYATSTILHYVILLIGFYLALAIMNVDLNKFTIIAGAFGVGLGFGLKNIVENFTSGLILLFERPIKVDDVVELNDSQGTLKRIGLRASVVRTVDGSEIIVPNAELVTQKVTNWTLSDPLRRVEIEVGVEYGADLEEVIQILERLGNKYSNPEIGIPAQALFQTFGESSLNFQLRIWTSNDDQWAVIKSNLSIEIYKALNNAGIEIPFVQRDLHLKSIDENANDKIKLIRNDKRDSSDKD